MENPREEENTVPADYRTDELLSTSVDETSDSDFVDPPRNAFRESLYTNDGSNFDADFEATLDENENPYIVDQLEDPALQREAESEYN